MYRMAIALIAVCIISTAGCKGGGIIDPGGGLTGGGAYWGMDGGNAQRQGRSSLPGPTAANLDWMFLCDLAISEATLVPDGRCFIESIYTIACLDAEGKARWRFQDQHGLVAGMYLSDAGLLYAFTNDNRLLAIDDSGTLAESYQLETVGGAGEIWFEGGRLYLLQHDSSTQSDYVLYAFSLTGDALWQYPISWPLGTFAVAADQVYLGRYYATIGAADLTVALVLNMDGELQWQVIGEQSWRCFSQVSADGHLYVSLHRSSWGSMTSSRVQCFTPSGDLVLDSDELADRMQLLAADAGDAVYAGNAADQVCRLHPDGTTDVLFDGRASRIYAIPQGRLLVRYFQDNTSRLAVLEHDGQVVHDWADPGASYEEDLLFYGDSILYRGQLDAGQGTSALAAEQYTIHKLTADWQLEWSFVERHGGPSAALVDSQGRLISLSHQGGVVLDQFGQGTEYNCFADGFSSIALIQPGTERLIAHEGDSVLRAYDPGYELAWEQPAVLYDNLAATRDVIAYSSPETVYVLDAAGNEVVTIEPEDSWASPPAIGHDGTLYFTCRDFHYAFHPDGTERFRVANTSSWGYQPVVRPDGSVIFHPELGLLAVSRSGEVLWQVDAAEMTLSAPAVDDEGGLYFTAYPEHLDWALPLPQAGEALAAQADPGEFEASGMYALDRNADLRWFTPLLGAEGEAISFAPQPIVDSRGRIYAGARRRHVFAVDQQGQLLWRYELQAGNVYAHSNRRIESMSIVPGARLVIGTDIGYVALGN